MKKLSFFLILLATLNSCTQTSNQATTGDVSTQKSLNTDSLKTVLMQADLSFSDLSSQKGTHEAFMTYVSDAGTLLRPYHPPIVGKDSIRSYLYSRPDSSFTLTWKPSYADVAASGDLGYTYGTYKLTIKNSKEFEEGTYITIWKQDRSGNWKFALDTGNPGLSPAKHLTN
jgi:ketosteroid isomerase-like protein